MNGLRPIINRDWLVLKASKIRAPRAKARRCDPAQIIAGVCSRYGVTFAMLTSKRRLRRWAWPRQELMLLLSLGGWSLSEIADLLKRDHTTVSHGIRAAGARASTYSQAVQKIPVGSTLNALRGRQPRQYLGDASTMEGSVND